MAARNLHPFGQGDHYHTFPGPRKSLLQVNPSNDPLLQSPLYFQGGLGSTTPSRRQSPTSSFGRHQPNHSHWAPEVNDRSHHRRSLPPPDLNQYRQPLSYRHSDQESLCSTVNVSPRRRSLPPNIGSPQRHQYRTKTTRSPPLWSVDEDDGFDHHEPMDISPVKPYPSPNINIAPSRISSSVSQSNSRPSVNVYKNSNHSDPKIEGINLNPSKNTDFYSQREGLKIGPPGIRKLGRKQEEKAAKFASKSERGTSKSDQGFSVCRFVLCTMILELVAGAAVLVTAFIGSDVLQFWCLHRQSLNTTLLTESFGSKVYGQHIAVDIIPKVLEIYLERESGNHRNKKPLVISLHGWTGVGKNYVSTILGEHLRGGVTNKIICPHHFPHVNEDYRQDLRNMIVPKLSSCNLNLFVIDEVDKAPPSVIQGLYDTFQEMRSPKFEPNLDNVNAVFLLLSNTGASHINAKVYEALYKEERDRLSLTYDEMKSLLLSEDVLKSEQFAWFSKLDKGGLIDAVVPFLPMEKEHVRMCIRKDMVDKGIKPSRESVEGVLAQMSFFPEVQLFSKSGCKKVPSKVDITGN